MRARTARTTRPPSAKATAASWIVMAAGMGFVAGMVAMAAVGQKKESRRVETRPDAVLTAAPVAAGAPGDDIEELRDRDLKLPVKGIKRDELRSNFDEKRGVSRRHEALDVLAPRNTPVLAVEDGTIAKLFLSKAGGNTIYEFDPTTTYAYYYAHLERYAEGLKDGAKVKRGDVIGYVGTTGNAPPDTPHLHFAIFKLTAEKRWWRGAPIDPYPVFK